jgi:hypothetical protein
MTTASPTVRKKRFAKKGKGHRNKEGRRVYALIKRKRPRGFAQDYKIFGMYVNLFLHIHLYIVLFTCCIVILA